MFCCSGDSEENAEVAVDTNCSESRQFEGEPHFDDLQVLPADITVKMPAPASAAPAPMEQAMPSRGLPVSGREFNVCITKHADDKLGIDVTHYQHKALKIKTLGPGLIEDWNKLQSGMRVELMDLIVEVNGAGGDCLALTARIKEDETLSMTILRPEVK